MNIEYPSTFHSESVPQDSKTTKLKAKLKSFAKAVDHEESLALNVKHSKSLTSSPITPTQKSFSSLPYTHTSASHGVSHQLQHNHENYSHPNKFNFRLRSNSLPNFNNQFHPKPISRQHHLRSHRPSQVSGNVNYSSYSLTSGTSHIAVATSSTANSITAASAGSSTFGTPNANYPIIDTSAIDNKRARFSPYNSDDSESIMSENEDYEETGHGSYSHEDLELRDFLKSPSPSATTYNARYIAGHSTTSSISNYHDDELIMIPPLPPANIQMKRPSLSSQPSCSSIQEHSENNISSGPKQPTTIGRDHPKSLRYSYSSTSVYSTTSISPMDCNTSTTTTINSILEKEPLKIPEEDTVDRLANSILNVVNIDDNEIKWGI
ncbi:uncharacterized protein RJT20DRAFT_133178 [Scheffersomyces xylosifermentans]|uniref:uncharacterized protein n=1 Tax=Scheffersomyces xylosifermentans TaxID=1304137 RepID=UPI00315D9183